MTTTIFRNNKKNGACIASDSRITWVDKNGIVKGWVDSQGYKKSLSIDDVLYGFAGTNSMFKLFLENYTDKSSSEDLLDTIVSYAETHRIQFSIIRYDGELKLFAYSPPNQHNQAEIYKTSTDKAINQNYYAIGSGKYSKAYKANKINKMAQVPIYKIISANEAGLRKANMVDLASNAASKKITNDDSKRAYQACQKQGGDLFTGGEVNMTKNATRDEILEQVAILEQMDSHAKAMGAVCASPIHAESEIKQLESLGHTAISPRKVEMSEKRQELFDKFNKSLKNSLIS